LLTINNTLHLYQFDPKSHYYRYWRVYQKVESNSSANARLPPGFFFLFLSNAQSVSMVKREGTVFYIFLELLNVFLWQLKIQKKI